LIALRGHIGEWRSDKSNEEEVENESTLRTFYGVQSDVTPIIRRVRVLLRGIFAQNGGLKGMRLGSPRKYVKMKNIVF